MDLVYNNNFVYLDDNHILSYNQNFDKKTVPVKSKYKNIYCVNCGEKGHVVKDCFGPITSFGIIAFKIGVEVSVAFAFINTNKQIKNRVECVPWHWKPLAVHSIDEVTAESKCNQQKR